MKFVLFPTNEQRFTIPASKEQVGRAMAANVMARQWLAVGSVSEYYDRKEDKYRYFEGTVSIDSFDIEKKHYPSRNSLTAIFDVSPRIVGVIASEGTTTEVNVVIVPPTMVWWWLSRLLILALSLAFALVAHFFLPLFYVLALALTIVIRRERYLANMRKDIDSLNEIFDNACNF